MAKATQQQQPVSAAVVFLLPAILISMVFLGVIGITVTLWKKALTNRTFRDNVLQLSTSTQNFKEAQFDRAKAMFKMW